MRARHAVWGLVLVSVARFAGPGEAGAGAPSPLEPPTTGGVVELDRDLAKLQVHARLLVVGAHPDDEDTSLLALVARGMGGEAAYLSLSRGEGGQNLIGPELGFDLGLLRSQELLAARRLDGGRQFFTRAFDFGYTRSLEETLRLWPRAVLQEDVVRVVRRFRPQVLVSIFPNDGGGGHGQHQAAGLVAHEAFTMAADPARFPGELQPWQAQALYRSTWFDRDQTTLVLPTGLLDPLTGRSVFQLAMASRSMHRSQDMGRLQEPGPRESRLGWVAGGQGSGAAVLFAGVDTRLRSIAQVLPAGELRAQLDRNLAAVEEDAARARAELRPSDPSRAVVPLRSALGRLRSARDAVAAAEVAGREAALVFLDEKIAAAERALVSALGLVVDAVADREVVVAGEPFEVTVSLWNASGEALPPAAVELVAREGWKVVGAPPAAQPVAAGTLVQWAFKVEVPAGAEPTMPYFLRRPPAAGTYDWSAVPAEVRGEPLQPPPLAARLSLAAGGTALGVEREVVHRYADQALGEIRRPLRATPPLEIEVRPRLLVWSTLPAEGGTPGERSLEVVLAGRARRALAGKLEVLVPAGWPQPEAQPFSLAEKGGAALLRVALRAPATLRPGRETIRLTAVLDGVDGAGAADTGQRVALALPLVDYPHVRPTPRPFPASVEVSAADLALPPLAHVGYVHGASDAVPEHLAAVGLPIALLDAAALAGGDLGSFDAIVVGSRAYETDPALRAANGRLLDYVRGGGLLVVQYQQYPFVEGGYAPYPLAIARPHDRVTDETAAIVALDPDHPVFTTPNRLGAADWEGWVQERGLYFAREWDPAYAAPLETADPGGPPQRGGLLIAKLGEGTYVYTGLAFFRQLPAGVPGAYRLFANLLALGR